MTEDRRSTAPVAPQPQEPVDNTGIASPPEPETGAPAIARGVIRLLVAHGFAPVTELLLPDGHRADVAAVSGDGVLVIVEIKSCVADFRSDQKWQAYRAYCDRLYFAVDPDFPVAILPGDAGLIVADRFEGCFMREAPSHPLAAARRKAMLMRFARAAALRLARLRDPALTVEGV